jgi:hypothetical protein
LYKYNLFKNILTKSFWKKVNLEELKPYAVTELIEGIDYHEFSKSHTIGLGFELLAVNNSSKSQTSIKSVRNLIADNIKQGKVEFNSALNLNYYLPLAKKLRYLFAALIVLKANEEYYLKQKLINSKNEPTTLTVTKGNITLFEELFAQPDY